jgi:hydroxymethylbilane synthase
MALVQANRVAAALQNLDPGAQVEVVKLSTEGDRWGGPLAALGGKGAFVRELDRGQLDGDFDIGVHCLKDIPGDVPLPEGLTIAAYAPREDVHDAVVSRARVGLDDLPTGAVVGTSSVRRCAQLARHWPALRTEPIRGNADTRLRKLDDGGYDAVILAVAGLQRLGLAARIDAVVPTDKMLPAIGAGVIAITTRTDDPDANALAARLDDPATRRAATAERTMLHTLSGHCHSPIAGHATIETDGSLHLHGAVYTPGGRSSLDVSEWGTDPEALGAAVAHSLLAKGARDIIDTTTP